jgi:hypothetical protein
MRHGEGLVYEEGMQSLRLILGAMSLMGSTWTCVNCTETDRVHKEKA